VSPYSNTNLTPPQFCPPQSVLEKNKTAKYQQSLVLKKILNLTVLLTAKVNTVTKFAVSRSLLNRTGIRRWHWASKTPVSALERLERKLSVAFIATQYVCIYDRTSGKAPIDPRSSSLPRARAGLEDRFRLRTVCDSQRAHSCRFNRARQ